jgi:hypothetical protein
MAYPIDVSARKHCLNLPATNSASKYIRQVRSIAGIPSFGGPPDVTSLKGILVFEKSVFQFYQLLGLGSAMLALANPAMGKIAAIRGIMVLNFSFGSSVS